MMPAWGEALGEGFKSLAYAVTMLGNFAVGPVLALGFALLALQGISELIKRIASLAGHSIPELETHYERPVQ